MLRNVETPNEASKLRAKVRRPKQMIISKGATKWFKDREVRKIHVVSEEVTKTGGGDDDAMDTDA